jgi:hypothetical protein
MHTIQKLDSSKVDSLHVEVFGIINEVESRTFNYIHSLSHVSFSLLFGNEKNN